MSIKEYVTGMTLITALISCENPNQYTIKQQQKQIALYQDSIIKLNERIKDLEDKDLSSKIEKSVRDLEKKDLSNSPALQDLKNLYKEILEELKKPPKEGK